MIRCDINGTDGGRCKFKGNPMDLIAEFTEIIGGFHELLSSKIGEETAEKIIATCGKAAYAKTVEEKQTYGEVVASMLTDALGIDKK